VKIAVAGKIINQLKNRSCTSWQLRFFLFINANRIRSRHRLK
jgi:hypothetical protein